MTFLIQPARKNMSLNLVTFDEAEFSVDYGEMRGNLMMKEKMPTWHSYGQVDMRNWPNIFTIAQGEINILGTRGHPHHFKS